MIAGALERWLLSGIVIVGVHQCSSSVCPARCVHCDSSNPRALVRGSHPVQLLGLPGVVQRPGPQHKVNGYGTSGRGHASLSAWYNTAWHGIRQACMWRDDGTRSAVKQPYLRVTVLVHGIPSFQSVLSPAKLKKAQARGWMGGEGLGRWCVHDPAPAHLALFL